MQLHDLLADLAGFDGAAVLELRDAPVRPGGRPRSRSRRSFTTAARCGPGALVLLHPGRGHRRPSSTRPRRSRAGAVALLVEEWLPLDVPQARVDVGARGARSARGALPRRARRSRCGCSASPARTARPPRRTCSSRSRARPATSPGVIGTVAARVGDRVAADRAHDARGDRAASGARRDARRRRRHRRDGGVVARARSASGRRDQLRGDVLHEPLARPPRLSRVGRRVLRGQGAPVHAGVHAARRDQRRTIRTASSSRARAADGRRRGRVALRGRRSRGRRHAPATSSCRRTARRSTSSTCGGEPVPVRMPLVGSFNVANALGRGRRPLCSRVRARRDRRRARAADRRAGPDGAGRRRPGLHGARRLRAHARRARSRRSARRAALVAPGGRLIVVFGCGGDRDRTKRPLMGEIAARLADRAYVTTDNPRSEDPEAIVDDDPRRRPERERASRRVLDRRAAIRDAVAAARPGDVVVVAGKGHETRADRRRRTEPFDDRVVAREELERARRDHDRGRDRAPRARHRVVGDARTRSSRRGRSTRARSSRARASSRCAASATATTSSPTRSRRARTVALVSTRAARARAAAGRRDRAGRRRARAAPGAGAARAAAARAELRVVGVAGSTGKTSTKDLLAAVLAPLGCYASPASYNNEFGLPITLLNAPGRRARRRRRDGRAVPRRRRGALCDRPARHRASSPTSVSRTPSTSAAPRARRRRWGSCSSRCPPAGSRC